MRIIEEHSAPEHCADPLPVKKTAQASFFCQSDIDSRLGTGCVSNFKWYLCINCAVVCLIIGNTHTG